MAVRVVALLLGRIVQRRRHQRSISGRQGCERIVHDHLGGQCRIEMTCRKCLSRNNMALLAFQHFPKRRIQMTLMRTNARNARRRVSSDTSRGGPRYHIVCRGAKGPVTGVARLGRLESSIDIDMAS